MSMDFVRSVDKDLTSNKIQLLLPAVDRVWCDGEPCFGYFSADDRMLVVAACNADWLEVLAHEYGHFKQDMEGCTYASAVLCEADAERRALG